MLEALVFRDQRARLVILEQEVTLVPLEILGLREVQGQLEQWDLLGQRVILDRLVLQVHLAPAAHQEVEETKEPLVYLGRLETLEPEETKV